MAVSEPAHRSSLEDPKVVCSWNMGNRQSAASRWTSFDDGVGNASQFEQSPSKPSDTPAYEAISSTPMP